ncbi:MAG: hypothetical protein M1837_002047 [Sclerophora amabilis]|nr:MAG: hypothetical protein M1837_002047 [Sclerophora amabilis]
MYPHQDQPGQHPQQYDNGGHSRTHPSTQGYLARPEYQESSQPRNHQQPPHTMASMATFHPQPDMYRMPTHPDAYRGPPQDAYRGPPPQHMAFNQPAPRQRTAIACRYCRRRKIRCSGFESSEDGRCTNCQRFHQECIFTPVSSQAQAFVPAHTAYPHLRNSAGSGNRPRPGYSQSPPVIYGAHGQPLSTVPAQGPYPAEPGYALPSPGAGGPSPSTAYSRPYDDAAGDMAARRRLHPDDHHSSVLPPPLGGSASSASSNRLPGRRESGGENFREFPDYHVQSASPTSSSASYQPGFAPQGQHQLTPTHQHPPYFPESRRTPPQSSSHPVERASHSPHGSSSTTSGSYPFPPGLQPPQPPQAAAPASSSRQGGSSGGSGGGTTPSPSEQQQREGGGRSGMSIQNLLDGGPGSQGQGGRSATDRGMLDALMPRRGM